MPSTSETPTEQAAAGTLAKQLRVFKLLAGVLAAALVLGGAAFLYIRHQGQPVTIFLNGKPVATVRNASTANALLAAAQAAKLGPTFAGIEPVRLQKVSMERAAPEASQDPDDAVQAKLERLLTLHVPAFVILVNKQPSLAFATPDDATKTLEIVKDHWAQMPPTAAIVGQTKITQAVSTSRSAQSIPSFFELIPLRRHPTSGHRQPAKRMLFAPVTSALASRITPISRWQI